MTHEYTILPFRFDHFNDKEYLLTNDVGEYIFLNNENFEIAAVIGDASISGGMAFEGLNIIGQAKRQMLIVLNDNRMSISPNVGALNKHLLNFRISKQYHSAIKQIKHMLNHESPVLQNIWKLAHYTKESLKYFALAQSLIFEKLGIVCTPPIDGHDITALRSVFREALKFVGPILVHVVTTKGKGYAPAEQNPELFHGVGPFDRETGELVSRKQVRIAPADVERHNSLTFTQAFSQALVNEAREDEDIVAITCAMKGGTGLGKFQKVFPKRFIDTGIAEENAVGMAAGLAIDGKKPVVAIYSSFLQRAIDQIIVDVALSNLDVVFCVDRAGIVGADGPTHHGAFDLAYLRMIPRLKVLCPSCEAELASALHTALKLGGPVAIRYPRGIGAGYIMPESAALTPELEVGRAKIVYNFNDPQVCILAFGPLLYSAIKAAEILKTKGITTRVIDMCWLKPLDVNAVKMALSSRLVATLEDGSIMAGAGSAVLEEVAKLEASANVLQLGIPDKFVKHGEQKELFDELGLSPIKISNRIETRLHKK
ncbi:MAG: 1-deoxy-D-xylulose-5-phosphate synthase [Eggerthellaceae bacterium]|nr:1-deoxy-D-xylulose-5-phosphate synthase [Eggerthellaceae bacterium]